MGVLEIAVASVILIAGAVGGSAVAGALLGRGRDIGAGRGFGWGLLLPVIGLGRVLASPKKEQASDQKKEASASKEQRQAGDVRQSAGAAAIEQFKTDNPEREYSVRRKDTSGIHWIQSEGQSKRRQ